MTTTTLQARRPLTLAATMTTCALAWRFELRTLFIPATDPSFHLAAAVLPLCGRKQPDVEQLTALHEMILDIRRDAATRFSVALDDVPTASFSVSVVRS